MMRNIVAIAMLAAAAAGCTQPEHARSVLVAQGYRDVKMTGYDFFNCSKDDFYHDQFSAISPSGQRVTGVVCAGLLFKGATVRLD